MFLFDMPTIRLATDADAAAIQAIYAPVVRETVISFEFEPPTVDEMRARMTKVLAHFPWLVYEREGQVLGYAYASRHSERAAYDWSANVSVYVSADARRMGVGTALYRALFELLRRQNIVNVYAGITLPNPASVGLHESLGMTPVGVYHKVGYKFGAWHDVGWWEMALVERPAAPAPVVWLSSNSSQMLTLVIEWVETIWNAGHLDRLAEFHPSSFDNHGRISTIEEARQWHIDTRSTFPDIRYTIEDVFTAGDRVAVRWTATATHLGVLWNTIPPTGRVIHWNGMHLLRVANQRIVEVWAVQNTVAQLQQMGVRLQPGQ